MAPGRSQSAVALLARYRGGVCLAAYPRWERLAGGSGYGLDTNPGWVVLAGLQEWEPLAEVTEREELVEFTEWVELAAGTTK